MGETHTVPPSFEDGLLMCTFSSNREREQAVIECVRFEEIGGRLFAVGRVPEGIVRGFDGKELFIAWDEVEQFYLMANTDEYDSAMNEWRNRKKAKRFFSAKR